MSKVISSPPETAEKPVVVTRVLSDPQRVPSDRPDADVAQNVAAVIEAAITAVDESDHQEPEQDSDAPDTPEDNSDQFYFDMDEDVDLEVDIETLEESGPGQFLIQRNAELIGAISALREEMEALRRIAESGKDTAADRVVRAIDRADMTATARGRSLKIFLALILLANAGLVGLTVYALWPIPVIASIFM